MSLMNNSKFVWNILGWDAIENRLSVWAVHFKMSVWTRIFFTDVMAGKFLLVKCSQALTNWIKKSSLFCFCKCLRLVDLRICFCLKWARLWLWFRISSIDIAWDYSREHRWDLITFGSVLFWESLSVSLCLKYLVHSFKWRVEPGVWEIVFSSCSRGNCIFFFGIFWFMYHSLDERVWLSITFLPLKQNLTLFQIWISFAIPSLFLSDLEFSRIELLKLNPNILMEILIISFVLVDQFYFCIHQTIRLNFLKSLSLSYMYLHIVLKPLVSY